MISHHHKCIFIHIPKTAGISIETYFVTQLGLTWENSDQLLVKYNPDPSRGPTRLDHMTCEEYIKYKYISRDLFSKYYKFTFVRNPWARLVSEYRYRSYHKSYNFTDFVMHHIPEPGYGDKYRHILPQYDFLHDSEGNLCVDFIGKFEQLQSDFNIICNHLNLTDPTLPRTNPSRSKSNFFERLRSATKLYERPKSLSTRLRKLSNRNLEPWHEDYRDYFNSTTKRLVEKMYEKDIDVFKYTFG